MRPCRSRTRFRRVDAAAHEGHGPGFRHSNRGACHKRAPIGAEITGQIDMNAYEGKAALVRGIQDRVNAIFTLVSCRFHEFVTPLEMYPGSWRRPPESR